MQHLRRNEAILLIIGPGVIKGDFYDGENKKPALAEDLQGETAWTCGVTGHFPGRESGSRRW